MDVEEDDVWWSFREGIQSRFHRRERADAAVAGTSSDEDGQTFPGSGIVLDDGHANRGFGRQRKSSECVTS